MSAVSPEGAKGMKRYAYDAELQHKEATVIEGQDHQKRIILKEVSGKNC